MKDGVAADPEKTEGVRTWPRPTNATELRSFLGLASYYRRFVRDFGTIAAPLNGLTEKGATFVWTEQADAAFKELKLRLTSASVLAYPQFDKPFILDTDASNVGIGGVLSQIQDGKECVIAYGSRSLTKSERNYCVTRRELLCVFHPPLSLLSSRTSFHRPNRPQGARVVAEIQGARGASRKVDRTATTV